MMSHCLSLSYLVICHLLLFTSGSTVRLPRISLDTNGNLVNDKGDLVKFHGFNSVLKEPPFYDDQALNLLRINLFSQWGFNVVRLGVIWSALVPEWNVVNTTYLNVIETIVNRMGDAGIYVILDMHQDGLSSRFASYDALPNWLLNKFPDPPRPFRFPWPKRSPPDEEHWFEAYLTYACQSAFQHIYSNTANAWQHWGDYWTILAKQFANNSAIIGYELINEPFAGNIYTNPLRALPGYAGRYNLLPVYDYLVQRIRDYDQTGLIFYEPVTWGVFGQGNSGWMGTGFHRVPGSQKDSSERNRSVLSYHYYCWLLQTSDPATELPFWKHLLCDKFLMEKVFQASKNSISITGGGRFLTEFGLCAPDNSSSSINTIECNTILDMADKYFQSWTYWDSMFFGPDGTPIEKQLRSFARVYPRSVHGHPTALKFDPSNSGFFFSFIAWPALSNQTLAEIFVPFSIHFPQNDFHINVEPSHITSEILGDSIVLLKSPVELSQETAITVEIFHYLN